MWLWWLVGFSFSGLFLLNAYHVFNSGNSGHTAGLSAGFLAIGSVIIALILFIITIIGGIIGVIV